MRQFVQSAGTPADIGTKRGGPDLVAHGLQKRFSTGGDSAPTFFHNPNLSHKTQIESTKKVKTLAHLLSRLVNK